MCSVVIVVSPIYKIVDANLFANALAGAKYPRQWLIKNPPDKKPTLLPVLRWGGDEDVGAVTRVVVIVVVLVVFFVDIVVASDFCLRMASTFMYSLSVRGLDL